MEYLTIIAASLVWAGFFLRKTSAGYQGLGLLFAGTAAGVVAGSCTELFYVLVDSLGINSDAVYQGQPSKNLLIYSLLVIGPVEEGIKAVALVLVAKIFFKQLNLTSLLLLSAGIGLGYASEENSVYLPVMAFWPGIGRAIVSPIIHVTFVSVFAYFWYQQRAVDEGKKMLWLCCAIVLAAFLHGVYDFFTFWDSFWRKLVPGLLVGYLFIWKINVLNHDKGLRANQCMSTNSCYCELPCYSQ